jgi:hypothetical protein
VKWTGNCTKSVLKHNNLRVCKAVTLFSIVNLKHTRTLTQSQPCLLPRKKMNTLMVQVQLAQISDSIWACWPISTTHSCLHVYMKMAKYNCISQREIGLKHHLKKCSSLGKLVTKLEITLLRLPYLSLTSPYKSKRPNSLLKANFQSNLQSIPSTKQCQIISKNHPSFYKSLPSLFKK